MSSISDLLTHTYDNFAGVDFTNNNVTGYRSPDSVNMWKDYKEDKCIQTRPGMTKLGGFDAVIYGIVFYQIKDTLQVLVHAGTKLWSWDNFPNSPVEKTELHNGMNIKEPYYFIFNNVLFIKDGINYLEYDGKTIKDVVGTIPKTSLNKKPDGSIVADDWDITYQPVNMLQPKRINEFVGDGEAVLYQLDGRNLDTKTEYIMEAIVDGEKLIEEQSFTVDREKGQVSFEVPPKKSTDGTSNVRITYSKTNPTHRDRVLKSTLYCEYDNRVFLSGNIDYPTTVWHSMLNDPRYFADTSYYENGLDLAKVKAIIPGSDGLWIVKEINQNSSSIYCMTPTIDSNFGKIYPSVNGNLSLGCISTGINFNDDIVYFSERGLEGVSGTIFSKQLLEHRSTTIDSKLLVEPNYKNVKLTEYSGYLLCLIDSRIYLADSRQKWQHTTNDIEYEWYYWELGNNINYMKEYRGDLYFANKDGEIFILDEGNIKDEQKNITSRWVTAKDNFGNEPYIKTSNKKGGVATVKTMSNDNIDFYTIKDGEENFEKTFSDVKGYFAYRVKIKKFRNAQLKFESNRPFGLFKCTLQAFVAGFVKR